MARYVFDIETDGLLPELTKLHSLVIKDIDHGFVYSCHDQPGAQYTISDGLMFLCDADLIIGHNIIAFDLHAIKKVYPEWATRAKVRDTMVMTRLIWPSDLLKQIDSAKKRVPGKLSGKHSLEAWGYRLMDYKGDFRGPWHTWTPEMQEYCETDVKVTHALWNVVDGKKYSEQAIQLEHDVQEIIAKQVIAGVPFDMDGARALYGDLVQLRLQLTNECKRLFPAWEIRTPFTPKVNNKKRGYVKGVPMEKVRVMEFNPASTDHIADRLVAVHGWRPELYGKDGKATVDESVLSALDFPEIAPLLRYTMIKKRIGQLAEGKQALMKKVDPDGRIRGGVITNGTVTGRVAHFSPNLGNVPKVQSTKKDGIFYGEKGEFGFEFRNLFHAPAGWVMAGIDCSGLELRTLGHYLARWDGGAYGREVVSGDVHALTMKALEIDSRDQAKTFSYAWLYGAGDEKCGKILKVAAGKTAEETKRRRIAAGKAARGKLLRNIPALKMLTEACRAKHRAQKFVRGLDGRLIHTRSDHSALNSLLQSGGSIIVKAWMVAMHRRLRERGWEWGKDFSQALYIHDELQFLCRPEIAEELKKIGISAIQDAAQLFSIRTPLDGEGKIGRTWAETH